MTDRSTLWSKADAARVDRHTGLGLACAVCKRVDALPLKLRVMLAGRSSQHSQPSRRCQSKRLDKLTRHMTLIRKAHRGRTLG
jgi:hypothetical protein